MDRKGPDEFRNAAPNMNNLYSVEAGFTRLNVKAHPLAYELQDALSDALDIDEVFIKGGAVRNMITGHEVDEIDAFFDIRQSPLMDEDNMDPQEMLEYTARLINSHGDFEDCKVTFAGKINGEPSMNIVGKYKGMEIDLHPVVHDLDVWTCTYDLCNSPILSACMDPDGQCWARPDFLTHLDAGLLIPDEDNDDYGIERLRYNVDRKYGPKYGWTYVHPSQVHLFEEKIAQARKDREEQSLDI